MNELIYGDCLEIIKEIPNNSIDALVTDPPAGISFMKKDWDSFQGRKSFVSFLSTAMKEILNVIKPGGYGLVWSIPKTSHWTALAIEEGGWEIKDCIFHLFGSGFPKGNNCLKPAVECWWLIHKPGKKNSLNIDECRIECNGGSPSVERRKHKAPGLSIGKTGWVTPPRPPKYNEIKEGELIGRWPANLCHDGSKEILDSFSMFGTSKSGIAVQRNGGGRKPGGSGRTMNTFSGGKQEDFGYGDSGSPARFFYCAKASKSERGEYNNHPTVKSISLMEWLVKLICPKNGVVIDPFMGSGSTILACLKSGRNYIGIEKNKDYYNIAIRRIQDFSGIS